MGFPRQECWSGLPFSSPGDCPDPGLEPPSPGGFSTTETQESPGRLHRLLLFHIVLFVSPKLSRGLLSTGSVLNSSGSPDVRDLSLCL